jgi:hypothetical protein
MPSAPCERDFVVRDWLPTLIFLAGLGQWSVLIASALVPVRLQWATAFARLPHLHRQLFWIYGGYVALSIVAFGGLCVFNAGEIAGGTFLARCLCTYLAAFWGIRLGLQTLLDVKPFLTTWCLTVGYHALTVLFSCFTLIFLYAALASG